MKKKILILGVVISLLITFIPSLNVHADGGKIKFDPENSVVKIQYKANDYSLYKVEVRKGKDRYFYNIFDDDEVFPLQLGDGTYSVNIYKKITSGVNEGKYRKVKGASKTCELEENKVYLQSIQNVDWTNKCKAVELAKKKSLDKVKDKEKFLEIYKEIVDTIQYDDYATMMKKAQNHRYLPVIDSTLEKKKGICYDYSSLMAGMLRSLGIPTKLMKGYSDDTGEVYHAWNEVFINGEWIVVDTTSDAQRSGMVNPEKDKKKFRPTKNY